MTPFDVSTSVPTMFAVRCRSSVIARLASTVNVPVSTRYDAAFWSAISWCSTRRW